MSFRFDRFEIRNDDDTPRIVDVVVRVFGGVVFTVELCHVGTILPIITMSETQFTTLFPGGQDILNNAMEAEA
jgi:hypothetical protein